MSSRILLFPYVVQCSWLKEVGIISCFFWWQCHKSCRAHCVVGCWWDHFKVQAPSYHHWVPPESALALDFGCSQNRFLNVPVGYCSLISCDVFHNCHEVIVMTGVHSSPICLHWFLNDALQSFHLLLCFLTSSSKRLHPLLLLEGIQVLIVGEFNHLLMLLSTPVTIECSEMRTVSFAWWALSTTHEQFAGSCLKCLRIRFAIEVDGSIAVSEQGCWRWEGCIAWKKSTISLCLCCVYIVWLHI